VATLEERISGLWRVAGGSLVTTLAALNCCCCCCSKVLLGNLNHHLLDIPIKFKYLQQENLVTSGWVGFDSSKHLAGLGHVRQFSSSPCACLACLLACHSGRGLAGFSSVHPFYLLVNKKTGSAMKFSFLFPTT